VGIRGDFTVGRNIRPRLPKQAGNKRGKRRLPGYQVNSELERKNIHVRKRKESKERKGIHRDVPGPGQKRKRDKDGKEHQITIGSQGGKINSRKSV